MENLIANNVLIAEFIGFEINHNIGGVDFGFDDSYSQIYLPHYPSKQCVHNLCVDELQFHTSWDWLMPVVEKIESLEMENVEYQSYSKNNFSVEIKSSFCQIISGDFLMDFDAFNRHSGSKLEATYKAVVEFIKWYNENK